jgi:hypothetical protein
MWLRICVALAMALSLPLTSSPAAAGGYSWMDWERRYQVVGGISVGRESDMWFRTEEAAQRAVTGETPYFVYLDDDPYRWTDRWHGPGRDAVRVGTVRVTENNWGGNIVNARVEFEVPHLASGTYTAYFCDSRCRHVMGDVYPASFVIVQSVLEGRLRARMEGMRQYVRSTAREVRRRMGDTTRQSVDRDHDIRIDLAQNLDSRADVLGRRIDRAIGIARDRNALRDSAAWFAAGFTAALALAFVVWRRKQARARLTLDDELAELAELTGDRERVSLWSRS